MSDIIDVIEALKISPRPRKTLTSKNPFRERTSLQQCALSTSTSIIDVAPEEPKSEHVTHLTHPKFKRSSKSKSKFVLRESVLKFCDQSNPVNVETAQLPPHTKATLAKVSRYSEESKPVTSLWTSTSTTSNRPRWTSRGDVGVMTSSNACALLSPVTSASCNTGPKKWPSGPKSVGVMTSLNGCASLSWVTSTSTAGQSRWRTSVAGGVMTSSNMCDTLSNSNAFQSKWTSSDMGIMTPSTNTSLRWTSGDMDVMRSSNKCPAQSKMTSTSNVLQSRWTSDDMNVMTSSNRSSRITSDVDDVSLMTSSSTCAIQARMVTSEAETDDTTIDDLTGYLDHMLHLPKPMSSMAEMMYI